MKTKKRFFAALSILLCVLCLALTGCGDRSVTLGDPTPAEFESVTKMRYNNTLYWQGYQRVEYRDSNVYPYHIEEENGDSWTFTPMLLDPQTGEVRELGICFPYITEEGHEIELSSLDEDLYWYDESDGLWYMILTDADQQRQTVLYSFCEETGEFRRCPVEEGAFGTYSSYLATEDKLYCADFTVLREIDLNTFAVRTLYETNADKKVVRTENPTLYFLDCDGQNLYLLDERLSNPTEYHINGYDRFKLLSIDLTEGRLAEVPTEVKASTVSMACGGSFYYVNPKGKTLYKMDFVTGESSPVGTLDVEMSIDRTIIGNCLLVETEEEHYLFSLETGEFLSNIRCDLKVTDPIRQLPDYVAFLADGWRNGTVWLARREAFETQQLNKAEMIELSGDMAVYG